MKPRQLAAIDLDGTLLSSAEIISARSRAALRAWTDAGNVAVVVSARPPRTIRTVAAGIRGLAIGSNGATLYDFEADTFVVLHPLAEEIVRQLVEAVEQHTPGVVFSVEYGSHVVQHHTFPREDVPDHEMSFADVLPLHGVPAAKLKVHHARLDAEVLWKQLALEFGHLAEITYSGARFVEFMVSGVTKATALAKLVADVGVEQQNVVAFGDMFNDLPMLKWAGRGVAMANGHPDVIAAADEVTLSNDNDGVAVVLERLLG